MKETEENKGTCSRRFWFLAGYITLLFAVVLVCLFLTAPKAETTDETKQTSVLQVQASVIADAEVQGSSLKITGYERVDGPFLEDGSDEPVTGVFAITVSNPTTQTLEYGVVTLTDGAQTYTFHISTLPAGASVEVMEADRAAYPANPETLKAALDPATWFSTEPTMCSDVIETTAAGQTISITNRSDTALRGPVYVYYKKYDGTQYLGGITYRVKFADGLAAGATLTAEATHYEAETSKLLFVTYVP